MSWQPIETAPKDGTIILLWASVIFTGKWDTEYNYWREWASELSLNPTHWQPLPKGPQ